MRNMNTHTHTHTHRHTHSHTLTHTHLMAAGVSVVPGRGASVRCAAYSPTHSQRLAPPPPGEQSPSCRSTRGGTQRPGKTSPPHLDTDRDRLTDRQRQTTTDREGRGEREPWVCLPFGLWWEPSDEGSRRVCQTQKPDWLTDWATINPHCFWFIQQIWVSKEQILTQSQWLYLTKKKMCLHCV